MNRRQDSDDSKSAIPVELLLAAATWGAIILGSVLLVAFWLPMRLDTRSLEDRADALAGEIAEQSGTAGIEALHAEVEKALTREAALKAQMDYWIDRRNTFAHPQDPSGSTPQQEDGRIDFKIALFNARTSLMARAEARNVIIPEDIGINETLSTDTRVESALGQLSGTMRLLEKVMNSGIQEVYMIQPQALLMKSMQSDEYDRLREYPVKIDALADFEECLSLLALLGDPDMGYSLDSLSIYKDISPNPEKRLNLQFVATAGRPLRRKRPGEGDVAPERPSQSPAITPSAPADPAPSTRSARRQADNGADSSSPSTNKTVQEATQ